MMKNMLMLALVLAAAAAVGRQVHLMAQAVTPPGKYISVAEWTKALDDNNPTLGIVAGQTANIVSSVVIRRRQSGPNNASVHTADGDGQNVTEIYQIIDGSGTYVTGGSIPDPKNRTAGIKGGESHDIKPGDVIIIPPGTAHWFSKINDHITYLEIRLPGNALAARK